MKQEYKDFQKSIRKTHKFGFTLKFEETFYSGVEDEISYRIVEEAISALDWELLYEGENEITAIKPKGWFSARHEVTITFHLGSVNVKSISTGSEMWDNGGNSRCVKLFIHVFKDIEKAYDAEKQKEVKQQLEDERNWVGYKVPEMLPPAPLREKPTILLPVLGALFSSVTVGILLAVSHYNLKHILILYEILAGIAVGYVLSWTMKWSNYINFRAYQFLMAFASIFTLFVSEYFLYRMRIRHVVDALTFFERLGYRVDLGISVGGLSLGPIGLIASWIFLVIGCYFVAFYVVAMAQSKYLIERVPPEVTKYAVYYLYHLEMPEAEVRAELAQKGWKKEVDQDEVFIAIAMIADLQDSIGQEA